MVLAIESKLFFFFFFKAGNDGPYREFFILDRLVLSGSINAYTS